MLFHSITDSETLPTSTTAPTAFPSPGRWEGDGRGDRGEVSGGGRRRPAIRSQRASENAHRTLTHGETTMTEIQWRDRLQPAMEEAREARRPLLLYFWTPE